MTSERSSPTAHATYALELHMAVIEQLGSQVRGLAIEVSDAGITLNGHCATYYIKQLTQEIVGKHTSRQILSNLIVVDDSPRSASLDS